MAPVLTFASVAMLMSLGFEPSFLKRLTRALSSMTALTSPSELATATLALTATAPAPAASVAASVLS